jgi:hypothetical protein
MTPKLPPRSDRDTLRALLDSGKLSPSQSEGFGEKYEQIVSGNLAHLSNPERKWADYLFYEHQLGEQPVKSVRNPAIAKSVRKQNEENRKELLAKFDAMARPKKPPGK